MAAIVHTFRRQPLLHFLALGALLFACYEVLGGAYGRESIEVGREQLLTLLQQRARQFDRARFERELDALSDEQRRTLEQDWLHEEVLYREARALGLDRDDYVVRQRLVRKLEFITRGFIESGIEPDRDAVQRHFAEHRDDYLRPATVTFTHVFFSGALHGRERALQMAQTAAETLNDRGAGFDEAPAHGDRYAYHTNYVERSEDYVAAQFDAEFARALFDDSAADGAWRGPLTSPLGFHVVLVTGRQPAQLPELEQIYAQVAADAREARVQEGVRAVVDDLLARYEVRVEASRP